MMIEDMDDEHLLNSIAVLERTAGREKQRELSAAYSVASFIQGEQAGYDIERDISRLEEMSDREFLEEYVQVYRKMKRIAKERGL